MDPDYIEGVVCREDELKDNEMKTLPLGESGGRVLLIKQKGQIHAIGTKCTHYGAPLETGALGDGRVKCPWHGACFNIKNGDIEDFPGLDSLPCYKVTVSNGNVKVRAKRTDLEINRRVKGMVDYCRSNRKVTVIVGGGPSGATCAETLRQEGFSGRIIMVCSENVLPYDRIKVSKAFSLDVNSILLRPQMFYDENDIEVMLGVSAVELDTECQKVKLSNGKQLCYDTLYLATGSRARIPDIPNNKLQNIFVVRDYTDASAINEKLNKEKHVVVLGTSFIGMEAAASCAGKAASVTVIGRDDTPLGAVFGEQIGNRLKQLHEEKGVTFKMNNNIKSFIAGEDGASVGKVELTNGETLPCDIAILGVGVISNTEWLKSSSVLVTPEGTIPVNECLQTNVKNIFAGGDIARAPVFISDNKPASIGHIGLAQYHGKVAAANMCGKDRPLRSVPFFWSMLFGKSVRYCGYGMASDIKIFGSVEDMSFIAYHINDGKVVAMSSIGRDPVVADYGNYLYEGNRLTEAEITKSPYGWMRNRLKNELQGLPASAAGKAGSPDSLEEEELDKIIKRALESSDSDD